MDAAELRPLRIGEILDVAIKIYRSHFATLVKAVALVVGPVQVLVAAVQASAPDTPFATLPAPEPTTPPELELDQLWGYLAALLVVSVLGAVASQLATAASLKAVSGAYMGEQPQWRESLRFAFGRLWPLAWLALLTSVLLFVATLACVVPGIYLYGAWAVVVPVLLLEDVRGRRALKRSRNLVRDRWWPTFGAIFLGAVLVFAVQAAFGSILGAAFFAGADNEIVLLVAQAIIGTLSGILTTPFSAALVAVVYFDLRVRKEGLDLELLAQRVGVEPPPSGARPALLPPPPQSWPGSSPPPSGWSPPPPSGWSPASRPPGDPPPDVPRD
ncbi:MAG: hypothetical protein M3378_04485 [Actinomycetota bacterium]|nr:hypothetical protein [Actinomycetota bacterium]MDQ3679796.1 hypothetical protein [Actinomycetota bacterium]